MKIIFTDGSTRGGQNKNGAENIGGFGFVVFENENSLNIQYAYTSYLRPNTTNNKMELSALIFALEYADKEFPQEEVIIYSDSAYVVNMCNKWIFNWAKNGWINTKKKPVENIEYVKEIYKHLSQPFYHCVIKKVPGHAGEFGNELADALATLNTKKFYSIIDDYDLHISINPFEDLN